jgi:hypothetical protein
VRPWTEPSDTALVNARRRLGPEPLAELFRQVARPLATLETKGRGIAVGVWSRSTALPWPEFRSSG